MNIRLITFAIFFTALLNANAGDLFSDKKPIEYTKNTSLDARTTIGGYPIYTGNENWKLLDLTSKTSNGFGGATDIPLGNIQLIHIEPNGDWFAFQQLLVNLATTGTNQYTTGAPCGGVHLVAVTKARGRDDNCLTIDASTMQSGTKSTTFFSIQVTQTRSAGRKYILVLALNAELLGFRQTASTDWSTDSVKDDPRRKAFVERLQKWAEMLQDAAALAIAYEQPKNAFDNIPSFRSLVSASSN